MTTTEITKCPSSLIGLFQYIMTKSENLKIKQLVVAEDLTMEYTRAHEYDLMVEFH